MSNQEILGLHRITKARIKELCKKNNLYQTPHLNDQLYLHYQGFEAIENLEEYTGLKCLWLESNAISEIKGLDSQHDLKCIFLQNNLIKKIENLQSCTVLDTLNLESNHITKIENCGVDVLPVLSTLNLSRNYLRSSPGLKELVNCTSLWSLDLSHNRIDDILVIKIFAKMPQLRVLILQGNPVVSQVPQYRKTLILECKNLTYLDSRPVFPKDRACAEAWKRGGYEEERRENERWARMDRKNIRDSVNATLRLRRKHGGRDVQLLQSTDDEEEQRPLKKYKKILEDDLEITGLGQDDKNKDIALERKSKALEKSSSDSSGSEHKLYGNKSKEVLEVIGDDDRNHLRTDAIDINAIPNDLVKCINTTDSKKDKSSRISKWLGEEVDQVQIKSKDINIVNPVIMNTSSDFGEHATRWNESSSSGSSCNSAPSDTSSNYTNAINNSGIELQNEDFEGVYIDVENDEKQSEVQISLEVSGGEKMYIADDILKLDISSVSLYDTPNKEPLEYRQNSDDENTLWEDTKYHYPIKSEREGPEHSLDTETDLSMTNWSISEIGNYTSTSFQNLEFSDEEDSGHFYSVDDSLRIKSIDGIEGLPVLENILPEKGKNDKHARISYSEDSILTDLKERKQETTKSSKRIDVGDVKDDFDFTVTVPSEREEKPTDDDHTFEILERGEDVTMPLDWLSTQRHQLTSSLFVEGLGEDSDLQMPADDSEASSSEYLLNDTPRNEVKSLNEMAEGLCLQDNSTSYQECEGAFSNIDTAEGDSDIANENFNKNIMIQPVTIADEGSKMPKEILCEDQNNAKLQLEKDEVDNECLLNHVAVIKSDPDGNSTSEKIKNGLENNKSEKTCLRTLVTIRKNCEDQDKNQKTCTQNPMTARKPSLKAEKSGLQNLVPDKKAEVDGNALSILLFKDHDEPNEVADKALNKSPIITNILQKENKVELDTYPVETLHERTGNQTITKTNDENRVQNTLPKESKKSDEMLKTRGVASLTVKDKYIETSYKHNITPEGCEEKDPTRANNSSSDSDVNEQSWLEETLAIVRNNEALISTPLSANEEDRENLTLQEKFEAHELLEDILLAASKKDFKTMKSHSIVPSVKLEKYDLEHTFTSITQEDFANTTISSSDDNEENSKSVLTLHDVLSSFNKVADALTTTRYLTSFTSTNDFSTQSGEQINRQVEEMKREQREQVSQMIDRVYAQTDKYDDTLEVVDGRLMVVKRSTGALEELPPLLTPSSSSKSTSCGVSTTQASCNDSDSNDYGTALSEDEPDGDNDDDNEDDDDVGDDGEQHASDTNIKWIPYLSAGCGNESLSSLSSVTGTVQGVVGDEENNCHSECNEQTFSSLNNDAKFHNEIDDVVFTKVTPAVTLTIDKEWRTEEAALMRKIGRRACESKRDGCDQLPAEDFDEAALEDVALIFEMPQ